jgi:hypothetical protein
MVAMKVEIENAAIELEPEQSLRLKGAADVRIVCRGGTVWVTQEGVLRDDFLRPGDALTLRSHGVTLVQAIGRAMISIEARPRFAGAVAKLSALPSAGWIAVK